MKAVSLSSTEAAKAARRTEEINHTVKAPQLWCQLNLKVSCLLMLIKIIDLQRSPWPLGHSRSGSSKVWDWSMGSLKMALGASLNVGRLTASAWRTSKKVTTFIDTTRYVGALRVPSCSLQLPRKRGIFLIEISLTSMRCWEQFCESLEKSVLQGMLM